MGRSPAIPPEVAAEMTPAVRAFVELLLARIDALEAENAELRRQLGQTPNNSSKPPSSEHPHAKADKPKRKKRDKRKRGGQHGHKRNLRPLVDPSECAAVYDHKPTECRRCGRGLEGEDADPYRHQVYELPPIKPEITEHRQHTLQCKCCGTKTQAPLPAGVFTSQNGPRLTALAACLMGMFRQSKRRTALFFTDVLNVPCSSGMVVKMQERASNAMADCYDELTAIIPDQPVVHLDETPTREANQKHWLWVAGTALFTVFVIRSRRAAAVVNELLGDSVCRETFSGTIVTDRFSSYSQFPKRQVCWSHLLRDFQGLIDAGDVAATIGKRLQNVGHELFTHWHRVRDGTIQRQTFQRHARRLQYEFYTALEDGQRCKHTRARGLCNDLFNRFDQLWTFASCKPALFGLIDPTNNNAERALRHAVIWRKLSFGTQSSGGSRFVERMLTVVETCRQQNRSVIEFLTESLQATNSGQPAPSLRPTP